MFRPERQCTILDNSKRISLRTWVNNPGVSGSHLVWLLGNSRTIVQLSCFAIVSYLFPRYQFDTLLHRVHRHFTIYRIFRCVIESDLY